MSEIDSSKEALPVRKPGRLETIEEASRDFRINILTEGCNDWRHTFTLETVDDEITEPKILKAEDLKVEETDKLRQAIIENGLLEERYWWLQPEMQEAIKEGRLKEQLSFFVGQKQMDFYCFDRELSQSEIDEIGSVLEQLAQIDDGIGFDMVSSVVFAKELPKQKYDDLKDRMAAIVDNPTRVLPGRSNGSANYLQSMIYIKDKGDKLVEKRLEGSFAKGIRRESSTSLASTLAHEIGHHMENLIDFDKWLKNHGWETPPGSEVDKLFERFTGKFGPSLYSGVNPQEDFAETFKYFILDPGKLDPKRLDFMVTEVLGRGETFQPINAKPSYRVLKRRGDEISLPRVIKQPMNIIITAIPPTSEIVTTS